MNDDEVKVTVLPAGVAKGAGDLRKWARRRNAGFSGLPPKKKPPKKVKKLKKIASLDRCAARAIEAEKEKWRNG